MPLDLTNIAEIVSVAIAAGGGIVGGIRLQMKSSRLDGSGDGGGAMLAAIEQLGTKIDGVSRQVGGVKLSIESLENDMARAQHDIGRLKPVVDELGRLRPVVESISQRVGALETRTGSR